MTTFTYTAMIAGGLVFGSGIGILLLAATYALVERLTVYLGGR